MSRSGTPTTPNAARRRPMVTVTLAPGTLDACAALGGRLGLNRGEVIDRAVAEMASRLDMPATPVLPRTACHGRR